jgi:DNA polymerase IV
VTRKIIHLDLDAFFCSVEELHNSTLRDKPFAVGGQPDQRGVVSSCSYAARQYHVRSAMAMAHALRLCPSLIVIPPRHNLYSQVSHQVMERLKDFTTLIEQLSIDEAFLDFSDSAEPGEIIARHLHAVILDEYRLPSSLGVATNKLVAKIATDVGKATAKKNCPPNAITIVPPGQEAEFLAPLPVEALWGVGPKTAQRLGEINILTIGDLAKYPGSELERQFGKNGYYLALHAKGIDNSPVVTEYELKSISQEVTFARDVKDVTILKQTLQNLSTKVGKRLKYMRLCGTTVKLKIRWPDFVTLTRQMTGPSPIDSDQEIYQIALTLFNRIYKENQSIRLIGVGISGLGSPLRQLSLWDHLESDVHQSPDTNQTDKLEGAINELKMRYGNNILHRGVVEAGTNERERIPKQ